MPALSNIIFCNFPSIPFPPRSQNSTLSFLSLPKSPQLPRIQFQPPLRNQKNPSPIFRPSNPIAPSSRRVLLQICHSSLETENPKDPVQEEGLSVENTKVGNDGNGRGLSDWRTSILLFALWGALIYYVFMLTPNQTPIRDMYFLKKLLYLKGDDGFRMNEVLVALWYIMGLWPLVYSMLLLPSGRGSRGNVPVWPFLVLSCFGGVYALLPYFVLWRPPPPPVDESELGKWPLSFLESKITAGIHITCIDFSLLSAFAPFWVYNDMTARKWYDKGSWLLPAALIPFLGPALYLVLRPTLAVGSEDVVQES
ncbi:hypothetical protein AAC387_Pa03g2911 [Persea americana]